MAAAVRLNAQEPRAEELALCGVGSFGRRVTALLAGEFPCSRQFHGNREPTSGDLASAFASDCAAVVVVVPRVSRAICTHADDLAYQSGKPWLPVVLEHPWLRAGPLVRPPSGPCFRCCQARRRQHDTEFGASAVIEAAYDADAALAPAGYLPHQARLGAAMVARSLTDCVPGLVFEVNVVTSASAAHPVISCHDCDRDHAVTGPAGALDLISIARQTAVIRHRAHTLSLA